MKIVHRLEEWHAELPWVCIQIHGKSNRSRLLKIAVIETMYAIWKQRNRIIFQDGKFGSLCSKDIIDVIKLRTDSDMKLSAYCNSL